MLYADALQRKSYYELKPHYVLHLNQNFKALETAPERHSLRQNWNIYLGLLKMVDSKPAFGLHALLISGIQKKWTEQILSTTWLLSEDILHLSHVSDRMWNDV